MKKLMFAATILTIAGLTVQNARAGDHEWATVGKVLTGVAAAAIVVNALNCQPAHASVTYSYSAPVCAPAPVVYAPQPVCYTPAPVVYAPRPVYYAPAPVIVYRAPVRYVAARPFVRGNAGYSHGHGRGYNRW